MMTLASFCVAVLALLCTPGPTNTLIAFAAAKSGWQSAARLIPAEVAGYLTAVVPLALAGGVVFARWPMLTAALKVAAAAWVLHLALTLWRADHGSEEARAVTAGRVYVTTLLNPKTLIVGLILLPNPGTAMFLPRVAVFCLLVVAAAAGWAAGGATAGQTCGQRVRIMQRVASIWLTLVSGTLLAHAFAA